MIFVILTDCFLQIICIVLYIFVALSNFLFTCQPVCLSVCQTTCLFIHLFIYLYLIYLSVHVSANLFIYLLIYLYAFVFIIYENKIIKFWYFLSLIFALLFSNKDYWIYKIINTSFIFSLSQNFFCIAILDAQNLQIKMNKTSKYPKWVIASSQTCQDDINLSEVLNKGEKSHDSHNSTGNRSESGTKINDHQGLNTASCKRVRLEVKLVRENVIYLSKRNWSHLEISLSKGLKFVPSDWATLKREFERLCLMWHFRNDKQTFATDKFRPQYE